MRGIKIPQYEFALKMQGGAYARGGAYLRDTTVVSQESWCISHIELVLYCEQISQ